jgi:hypothetical protein
MPSVPRITTGALGKDGMRGGMRSRMPSFPSARAVILGTAPHAGAGAALLLLYYSFP